MHKGKWLVLGLGLLLVSAPVFGAPFVTAPAHQYSDQATQLHVPGHSPRNLDEVTIVYEYDFEGANVEDDWTFFDPAVQPNYWHESDFEPSDGLNWYCGLPTNVYGNDWTQIMRTPALDLSDASAPMLSFMLRLNSEADTTPWDGGTVLVHHGADEGSAVFTPVPVTTGPAYVGHISAFGTTWGAVVPGWSGVDNDFNDWSAVTMDLSDFTDAYVRVIFLFASDGSVVDGSGMQLDDIQLADGEAVIWADDADGNNVGGAPTFLSGSAARGNPPVPQNFEIFDGVYDPPSPTHSMGTEENPIGQAYTHYFIGPEFDLPAVEAGDKLLVDYAIRTGWNNADADFATQQYYYVLEIYNPTTGVWANVNTIDGGANYAMNHYLNSGNWTTFSTAYTNPAFTFDITNLANREGLRFRIRVRATGYDLSLANGFWDFMLFDDFVVEHHSVAHDVGFVSGYFPFPRTVGMPTVGTVLMANLGPNEETVPIVTWNFGSGIRPVVPAGPYNMDLDEAIVLTLDAVPTDNMLGWVPTTAGNATISVQHNLDPDDIPANNTIGTTLPVMATDVWEMGYDGSFVAGALNLAYYEGTEGAMVHVVPQALNPGVEYIGHTLDAIKINLIWYDAWYGAGTTVEYEVRVYAGGPLPGALLWASDAFEFSNPDGSANLQRVWTTHALPTPIEFEAGEDYYIFYRPLSGNLVPGNAFEHIPFITGQANTHMGESAFSWRFDPATGLYTVNASSAWLMRGVATPDWDGNGAPTAFDLVFPDEVVQFPDVGFIWGASEDPEGGPIRYTLTINSGDESVSFTNLTDHALAVDLAGTALGAEPNQEYTWSVTATDYWGEETESGTGEFRMADLNPVPFALTSPGDGVEVQNVTVNFEWEESHSPLSGDGVTVSYRLIIESEGETYEQSGIEGTSASVNVQTHLGAVPDQEYTWYVIAEDSDGRERMSDSEFEFTMYDLAVGEGMSLPTEFAVGELYPNPFNPTTAMRVALPTAADVSIQVFDVLGRQVASLTYGQLTAGYHTLSWGDANASSGLYIFVVKAGPMQVTRKAVFMK